VTAVAEKQGDVDLNAQSLAEAAKCIRTAHVPRIEQLLSEGKWEPLAKAIVCAASSVTDCALDQLVQKASSEASVLALVGAVRGNFFTDVDAIKTLSKDLAKDIWQQLSEKLGAPHFIAQCLKRPSVWAPMDLILSDLEGALAVKANGKVRPGLLVDGHSGGGKSQLALHHLRNLLLLNSGQVLSIYYSRTSGVEDPIMQDQSQLRNLYGEKDNNMVDSATFEMRRKQLALNVVRRCVRHAVAQGTIEPLPAPPKTWVKPRLHLVFDEYFHMRLLARAVFANLEAIYTEFTAAFEDITIVFAGTTAGWHRCDVATDPNTCCLLQIDAGKSEAFGQSLLQIYAQHYKDTSSMRVALAHPIVKLMSSNARALSYVCERLLEQAGKLGKLDVEAAVVYATVSYALVNGLKTFNAKKMRETALRAFSLLMFQDEVVEEDDELLTNGVILLSFSTTAPTEERSRKVEWKGETALHQRCTINPAMLLMMLLWAGNRSPLVLDGWPQLEVWCAYTAKTIADVLQYRKQLSAENLLFFFTGKPPLGDSQPELAAISDTQPAFVLARRPFPATRVASDNFVSRLPVALVGNDAAVFLNGPRAPFADAGVKLRVRGDKHDRARCLVLFQVKFTEKGENEISVSPEEHEKFCLGDTKKAANARLTAKHMFADCKERGVTNDKQKRIEANASDLTDASLPTILPVLVTNATTIKGTVQGLDACLTTDKSTKTRLYPFSLMLSTIDGDACGDDEADNADEQKGPREGCC
jgi:hypothetical protein